jgi:hypothetical protein
MLRLPGMTEDGMARMLEDICFSAWQTMAIVLITSDLQHQCSLNSFVLVLAWPNLGGVKQHDQIQVELRLITLIGFLVGMTINSEHRQCKTGFNLA